MKAKTLLLSLFFTIAVIGLKAQTITYDYAMVKYNRADARLYVSKSNAGYEKVDVPKAEVKDGGDYTFFLNYVQQLTSQGWRVMNVVDGGMVITFFLERKKKEQ